MTKRSILILFLLLMGVTAPYQNMLASDLAITRNSLKSELLRKLSRTELGDEARLVIYEKISKIVHDTQTKIYYIDKLLKEAQEQKNNEYICEAYLARLILAYNTYDVEGVNRWYSLLEPIARKEKLYTLMFSGRRGIVDMFNVTGDYEREEKEALKMLEEARALNNDVGMIAAYQCLSHAYRATFRTKEAAQILEKGYDIAYRTHNISAILEVNNLLIGTYQRLGDQTNILKWTKNLDHFLTKEVSADPSEKVESKGFFLLTYLAYLSYYTVENDLNNAAKYLRLAEEYKISGYGVYENYYHLSRLKYFTKIEMYEQALVEVNMIIDLFKELSPTSYGNMNFQKAYILEQLGRIDDALALYKRSFSMIDSINVTILNKQTEQLKKDYDTDQLSLRKERIQSNIQTLFLVIVTVVVIILICFVFHAYHIRKGLKKSEEEMRRMAEEVEQANVAKELFLSNISTSISIPLNTVVDGSMKLASDEVQGLDERKKISQTLNKTSAKLMELINNILNLSRLEASMMKFQLGDIEIIPFVQGIAMLMRSREKEVELTLPETEKELKIYADVARLQEIFNNVLVTDKRPLKLFMRILEDGMSLEIKIVGSILADNKESLQEITIANEVNRLLAEYFGGQYSIKTDEDSSASAVYLILPLV